MKFLTLCTFLVVLGVASANTKVDFAKLEEFVKHLSGKHHIRRPIETINDFADMIIEEYQHFLKQFGLDPMPLPDLNMEIPFPKGSFNLTKGEANDLSDLYRDGNVIIDYDENRIFQANITLFFKKITMNYHYNVDVAGIKIGGKVTGTIIYLPITVSLKIDFIKYHVSLQQFGVPEIGNIKILFEDGIADWLLNLLNGMMAQTFEDLIINMSQGLLKDSLEDFIEVVNKILDFIFNQNINNFIDKL